MSYIQLMDVDNTVYENEYELHFPLFFMEAY